MMGLWLSIPAYIAIVFLIIHHYRYRGGLRPTLGFFGSAIAYGLIRENLLAFFNPAYTLYGFVGIDLWIGLAPLVVSVGWTFAAYTSWYLASLITGIDKPLRSRMPYIATLAGLIAATISFIIEMPAVAAGWWSWNFSPTIVPFFMGASEGLPLLTLGGWAMTVGIFLFCYWCIAYHKTRWRYVGIIGIILHFIQLIVVNAILTV